MDYVIKNISAYDSLAEEYEQNVEYKSTYTQRNVNFLFKLIGVEEPKILDLGCGIGYSSYLLQQKSNDIVAVDSSPSMLNYAKRRSKGIKFLQGNILDRSILGNYVFDAIFAQEIIHLFDYEDAQNILAHWLKILTPNGVCLIVINDSREDAHGFFKKKSYSSKPSRFKVYWTRDKFVSFVKKSGFDVIFDYKVKHPGGFYMRAYGLRKMKDD